MITRAALVDLLDRLDLEHGLGQRVELAARDRRVVWGELEGQASGLPALPFGQDLDVRLPLEDGRSLHLHVYASGVVRAHVDQVDPERSPVGHLVADTWGPRGALAGAAIGGAAMRTWWGAVGGAILGFVGGLGVQVARPVRTWHVVRVLEGGQLEAVETQLLELEVASAA